MVKLFLENVKDNYTMLTAKKKNISYTAKAE